MRTLSLIIFLSFSLAACMQQEDQKNSPEKSDKNTKQPTLQDTTQTILFFGNSITAGYGLSMEQAFPNLIQQKLDSLGWSFEAVNAGLSGETTAGGRGRVSWLTEQYEIYVLFLALGGNDGLRGIEPQSSKRNLQAIIDSVGLAFPDASIVLAGMEAPPNMGETYTSNFRSIYPELAEENDVTLMPFLLKDVAGEQKLNQADGIHPTAEGQRIVAENVWKVLKPVLDERKGKQENSGQTP